jgi:hypothetical protein
MTTAEMSMTTNTARALIDARLETVERALFGRISRAERLDIVGEIESRIDELLRDRCGPGVDPSREDVLAVLGRLDPPEAYLDFESGESVRLPAFEKPVRPVRSDLVSEPDRLQKLSLVSGICGIVGLMSALLAPVLFFVALGTNSALIFFGGCGFCGLVSLMGGSAAIVFAGMSRLKTPWSIAGLILGVISVMLAVMGILIMLFGDF